MKWDTHKGWIPDENATTPSSKGKEKEKKAQKEKKAEKVKAETPESDDEEEEDEEKEGRPNPLYTVRSGSPPPRSPPVGTRSTMCLRSCFMRRWVGPSSSPTVVGVTPRGPPLIV